MNLNDVVAYSLAGTI